MSPAFPLPSKPLGNLTAANTVPGLTLTSGSGKATTKPVAKESSSELPPAVKKAVKEFMQNGLEREAAGNCSTAVQIFQQILQLEPDNTAALCASARIWSKASKHSRAMDMVAMLEERIPDGGREAAELHRQVCTHNTKRCANTFCVGGRVLSSRRQIRTGSQPLQQSVAASGGSCTARHGARR